jgi:acetylornithine/succinyldiaminopimelate/putrescine aminotransferase
MDVFESGRKGRFFRFNLLQNKLKKSKEFSKKMLRDKFFRFVGQTSPEPMALEIQGGEGCWLYDVSGKAYLDLISGISVSSLGHGNPAVKAAIHRQTDLHLHTLVYGEHIQAPQVQLAEALAGTLKNTGIDQFFFVNSGSEAIEGAMKLAKRYTGRFELIACRKAYHGSSHGALSLSDDENRKQAFRPLLPGIGFMNFGSIEDLSLITEKTAAVFIETVQGEAGVRCASAAYFQALRKRCDETGTLLILDEIQAGFGRTGTFWAFEQYGIVPDVLVMAKAMGGGLPLGAFAASAEIMQCLTHNPVLGHISTYGGHPLSCAASLAALEFMHTTGLVQEVKKKETLFRQKLQHPQILEVRSAGLLMAGELGSFDKVLAVIKICLEKGLITDWFLNCDTALRIAPPLIISEEEIDKACGMILEALGDL